jgi:hypothetical protein
MTKRNDKIRSMEIEAFKVANEMVKAGKLKGKAEKPSKAKRVLQNQVFDEAAEISKHSSILHPDGIPNEMIDHPLAKAKLYHPPVRKGMNKMFLLREKHRKQKLIREQEKLERMKKLGLLQPKAIKVNKQFTKVFRDPITNPTAKMRRAALSNFAAFSEIQHQFDGEISIEKDDLIPVVEAIAQAADERKANYIHVMRVTQLTSLASFIIVIEGNSKQQNSAIQKSIEVNLLVSSITSLNQSILFVSEIYRIKF